MTDAVASISTYH